MILSRVVSDVVATQKHDKHEAINLLLVQPIRPDGSDWGSPFVAVDVLDSGVGDTVLLTLNGWAAMSAVRRSRAPIDAAVIGIVDEVEWHTPAS